MVTSPITRSAHPKALWPGVRTWFGNRYQEIPRLYPAMFDEVPSDKAYEEYVQTNTFGSAFEKPEGTAINYDGESQGYTNKLQNKSYALGYIVTMEEIEDNLYSELSQRRSARLALAMARTKEFLAASIYNRAFTAAYAYGDGKELMATDHPTLTGTQSNELGTPADLSEASLEDILIQLRKATDNRGNRINLMEDKLILPVDLEFEIERILKSPQQSGTDNNDINAMNRMGKFPGGVVTNPYLTDVDAWFVRTKVPAGDGMIYQNRKEMVFDQDNDFDTKNARASAHFRCAFGNADWRAIYGSPGA